MMGAIGLSSKTFNLGEENYNGMPIHLNPSFDGDNLFGVKEKKEDVYNFKTSTERNDIDQDGI